MLTLKCFSCLIQTFPTIFIVSLILNGIFVFAESIILKHDSLYMGLQCLIFPQMFVNMRRFHIFMFLYSCRQMFAGFANMPNITDRTYIFIYYERFVIISNFVILLKIIIHFFVPVQKRDYIIFLRRFYVVSRDLIIIIPFFFLIHLICEIIII